MNNRRFALTLMLCVIAASSLAFSQHNKQKTSISQANNAGSFGQSRQFATGFTFPEGPVLDCDGNLYLVNFKATMIHRVTPDGDVSVVVDIGAFNNGAIFDSTGNLIIASSGLRAILKFNAEDGLTVLASVSDGDSLLGPNDMAWDDMKTMYVTCPEDWVTDNGKVYTLRVPVAGVKVVPSN